MRATIVIPSYWARKQGEPLNLDDAVYDHPTPLDTEGTLGRSLESIRNLDNKDFTVVVLACATSPDIEKEVEERVREIAEPFGKYYPISVMSHEKEREIRARVAGSLGDDVAELVSLTGYSNIRNMCLIAAHLEGSEMAVLFDDDELYEDPGYLDKVFDTIEGEFNGKPIRCISGYYQQPDGSFLMPPPKDYWMVEWPMAPLMNKAFGIIASEPRLKLTPFVFGGNMIVHRDVFMKIAFDPNVRRGEDIDYLTNCKFFDIDFVLDRELAIKHLPPEKSPTTSWQHFRANVYRFVYAREKLRRQVPGEGRRIVDVSELDPYPGGIMRDNLEDLVFKTSTLMAMMYLKENDELGYNESMKNIHAVHYEAVPVHDPYLWYLDCRERWEKLMAFLEEESK